MADARAGAEIGNDALREVFARLPGLRDLVRCAATCKRWRRLVTDRDFLRRVGLWQATARRPCVLAGIFSQNIFSVDDSRTKSTPYAPPRFLSLQAGLDVRDRCLTFDSFVTIGDDDRLFHLGRPLASRRGFLLTRLLLPSPSPGTRLLLPSPSPGDNGGGRQNPLAVCRPLLDRRSTYLLPPPPFDMSFRDHEIKGCAILTPADHPVGDGNLMDHKQQQEQPMFQVLLIYYQDEFVCACTYSSDMPGDWSAPIKCCRVSGLTKCGPRAGVVTHGFVHWLFKDDNTNLIYTLDINVATSHASLTKTAIKVGETFSRAPIPCIAGPEERLSLVTIQDHGVADLWTKLEQDGDGHEGDWKYSELTKLGNVRIDMVFFAEKRGALLIEQGGAFSIVDLKSKEKMPMNLKDERTERLKGTRWFPAGSCSSTCCCGGHYGTTCPNSLPGPVLYEMDWAFMSFVSSQVGDEIKFG